MNQDEYNKITEPHARLSEINDLVDFASRTYKAIREKHKLTCGDGDYWDGVITDYMCSEIELEWEYTWQYGGHASGTNYIPVEAILGTEQERIKFIEAVVVKEVNSKHQQKAKILDAQKATRKKQFDKLKQEFEPES